MKLRYLYTVAICLSATLSSASCDYTKVWQEIAKRWQAIWQEQLQGVRAESDVHRYARKMLDFTNEDMQVAKQMVGELVQGAAWDAFLQAGDVDTTFSFIAHMTEELKPQIWNKTELVFPPNLHVMSTEIKRSGMHEDLFICKVRQAFLAFSLVVTRMYYMTQPAS